MLELGLPQSQVTNSLGEAVANGQTCLSFSGSLDLSLSFTEVQDDEECNQILFDGNDSRRHAVRSVKSSSTSNKKKMAPGGPSQEDTHEDM